MVRMVQVALVLISCVYCSACSSDGRRPTYPISGRVTYQGQPTPGARVAFIPLEEALLNASPQVRPNGRCDREGKFQLTTYLKDDGAPAGEHRVILYWDRNAPLDADDDERGDNQPAAKNFLPAEYADRERSILRFTVKDKDNAEAVFQVP